MPHVPEGALQWIPGTVLFGAGVRFREIRSVLFESVFGINSAWAAARCSAGPEPGFGWNRETIRFLELTEAGLMRRGIQRVNRRKLRAAAQEKGTMRASGAVQQIVDIEIHRCTVYGAIDDCGHRRISLWQAWEYANFGFVTTH